MKPPLVSFRARLAAAFAALLALASSASAVIERHQLPPIASYAASPTYQLTVDGLNVQVTRFDTGYDYAHFTRVSGSMNIQVKTLYGSISQWAISPAKLPISATRAKRSRSLGSREAVAMGRLRLVHGWNNHIQMRGFCSTAGTLRLSSSAFHDPTKRKKP